MKRLGRFLSHFKTQTRGNVAIITALIILPLTLAVGGGIDFANVVTVKGHLQDAADEAALAAALNSAGNFEAQKISANKAFAANLTTGSLKSVPLGQLTTKVVDNVQIMSYAASAQVKTYILGLAGLSTMNISVVANAGISLNSAEIAFVLDNTGSMAQNNKMTALKTSLTNTLNSLLDSNGNNTGRTKVALVPFDTQVALDNVSGMSDYAGSFTSNTPVYTCTGLSAAQCSSVVGTYSSMCNGNSSCADNQITSTRSYSSNGRSYYAVMSTSYFKSNQTYRYYNNTYNYYYIVYRIDTYRVQNGSMTLSSTDTDGGYYTYAAYYNTPNGYSRYYGNISYSTVSAGGYNSHSTVVVKDNDTITANDDLLGVGTDNWSGCVIDRYKDSSVGYDVTSDAPVISNPNTLYPAAKCATNSLLPIKDLTTDIKGVRDYAAGMKPAGNTNVTIGIQWGMEVLSPTAPFTTGAAFTDKTVNKYMIILTDGANTQNRWTTNQSQIDARTALACENAKALGITIFTVGLEIGDSSLLKKCASSDEYYYNLSSSTQLNGALGGIMKSIKKIRLTK
ncbi:MAG: pilus assembly protein TadG-related protein [Asticcacaulis sp.]